MTMSKLASLCHHFLSRKVEIITRNHLIELGKLNESIMLYMHPKSPWHIVNVLISVVVGIVFTI